MKKTIIVGLTFALLTLFFMFSIGCKFPSKTNVTISPEPELEINPITGEPYKDIKEKRGFQTNIKEFNDLIVRASKLISFNYKLTDTELGIEGQQYFVLHRFMKTQLSDLEQHSSGQWFDEVMMERTQKIAFSHCSKEFCPRPDIDLEVEKVDYEYYYNKDPMEYIYSATKAEYVKDELLDDDYTKVFNVMYEGQPARVWLQEYYGYPLKIVVRNSDNTKRTIKFEDMEIDTVRRAEIDLPFNFTVSGEGNKRWVFWEHYLGEWPKQGQRIEVGQNGPALGV